MQRRNAAVALRATNAIYGGAYVRWCQREMTLPKIASYHPILAAACLGLKASAFREITYSSEVMYRR